MKEDIMKKIKEYLSMMNEYIDIKIVKEHLLNEILKSKEYKDDKFFFMETVKCNII